MRGTLQAVEKAPGRLDRARSPQRVRHVDHDPVRHLVVGAQPRRPERRLHRRALGNHRDHRERGRGERQTREQAAALLDAANGDTSPEAALMRLARRRPER